MKNNKILLTLILIFSILSLQLISTLPDAAPTATPSVTQTQNPISAYLAQNFYSESLKYIGLPSSLALNQLIVYLLVLIIVIFSIYEILGMTNLINSKLINFGISLILTLIGIQKQILYNLIQPLFIISEFSSRINYLNTGLTLLLGIAAIIILRTLKRIFKRMKESSDQEKLDEEASRLKALGKAEKIEEIYHGIYPVNK